MYDFKSEISEKDFKQTVAFSLPASVKDACLANGDNAVAPHSLGASFQRTGMQVHVAETHEAPVQLTLNDPATISHAWAPAPWSSQATPRERILGGNPKLSMPKYNRKLTTWSCLGRIG